MPTLTSAPASGPWHVLPPPKLVSGSLSALTSWEDPLEPRLLCSASPQSHGLIGESLDCGPLCTGLVCTGRLCGPYYAPIVGTGLAQKLAPCFPHVCVGGHISDVPQWLLQIKIQNSLTALQPSVFPQSFKQCLMEREGMWLDSCLLKGQEKVGDPMEGWGAL